MCADASARWPALAHLLFVVAAVLDVRARLPGPSGEFLFWGLATLSCWYVGTTIGRGTSLVKSYWRPNDAVKFPITLLLGAFPAN